MARQRLDGLLARAEQRRQLGAERDARGAGQRREVDQQVGSLRVGRGQRVGEHQAALGIGVADLDA